MRKIRKGPHKINGEKHGNSVDGGKRVQVLRKGVHKSMKDAAARGELMGRTFKKQ